MLRNTTLRPNKKRGQNAISMIYAVMLCFILSAIIGLIYNNAEFNYSSTNVFLIAQIFIKCVYIGVFIISATTFIMWFRRAYYNLNQMTHNTIYSAGWVAGFWFIPIVNLFKPYSLMREMYENTNNLLADDIKGCVTQKPISNVNLWWTLWIIFYLLGLTIAIIFKNSQEILNVYRFVQIGIYISLTFATIKVIRDYMEMEEVMQEMAETYREAEIQKLRES